MGGIKGRGIARSFFDNLSIKQRTDLARQAGVLRNVQTNEGLGGALGFSQLDNATKRKIQKALQARGLI